MTQRALEILKLRLREGLPRHAIRIAPSGKIECELCLAKSDRLLKSCPSPEAIVSANFPIEEVTLILDTILWLEGRLNQSITTIAEARVLIEQVIEALEQKNG